MRITALAALLAFAACRPAPRADPLLTYEPPEGKRSVSIVVDKSQAQFLAAGDAVEVVLIVETPRADATTETRSETLAARAEVLRVKSDWSAGTGLIALALTPEEAQVAALAVDREDKLYLHKAAPGDWKPRRKAEAGEPPALEKDQRGLAVLAYPDQQEFLVPGDRIDVIATRQGYKAGGKSELTAMTILQDVLVLRAGPPEGDEEWAAVQLMVSTAQAQVLTRASADEEHLALPVRAPGDRTTRPVEPSKMSRKIGVEAERSNTRL